MTLTLLDSLSLPGATGKPNEDSFAHLEHAALVLDGATPLGPPLLPGASDAQWIAQFGARRLAAYLRDGDAPQDALRHALADAEKSFAGLARAPIHEKWQTPCAAMMLAVELDSNLPPPRAQSAPEGEVVMAGPGAGGDRSGSEIELLWFGDCAALLEQDGKVELIGETLDKRRAEAARAQMIARDKNLSSTLGVERPEIEPLLRAARNRINSGRNWLFSPDTRAAAHVTRRRLRVEEGACLLLASDGFLALVSDYDAYDDAGLMKNAKAKGLAALGRELRVIEENDALGVKFPRFKKSDDATVLLLRLNKAQIARKIA